MMQKRKTALVVLFNHNYEKNIPVIKKLYKNRFSQIKILMPFYYGDDEDVIHVYGNSFVFHTYIAQAKEKLMQMDCDDFLIIGDDLLLNPELCENNIHEKLAMPNGAFYIDAVEDVSKCDYNRPVLEASRFSPYFPGLDGSANRCVPGFDEALQILQSKNLISFTRLSRWKPFYPLFKKGWIKNFRENYKIFKARVWHFLKVLQYKIRAVDMPYPYVFGYSDILMIPREKMLAWCSYLEVFATWNMFVEMAIPTAMMLLPETTVCFANQTRYKTGNVWYPQNPRHFDYISSIINKVVEDSATPDELASKFPMEYLYLHPVKLSRYNKSQITEPISACQ